MFEPILSKLQSDHSALVLTGNINDQFLSLKGETLTLIEALEAYLADHQWTVTTLKVDETKPEPQSQERGNKASSPDTLRIHATGNILNALNNVLNEDQNRRVIIVPELEQLFLAGVAGTLELQYLRRLIKVAAKSHCHLLLITQEGAPQFIANLPEVAVLGVPKPNLESRERYFRSNPALAPVATDLALRTEGFYLKQCRALACAANHKTEPDWQGLIESQQMGWPTANSPWDRWGKEEERRLEARLRENIYGQDNAINTVMEKIRSAAMNLNISERNQPRGVFFFCGPTGTGKTEICDLVAKEVFHGRIKHYDMGEFKEPQRVSTLLGSPNGYVGSDQGGDLVNWVRDNPYSLILFDEIEKAHPSIFSLFLSMLDYGKVTSATNETAYLNHSIIAFTSNIGTDKGQDTTETYQQLVARLTKEDIPNNPKLDSAFIGRINPDIQVFDWLRPEVLEQVVQKFAHRTERMMARRGIQLYFEGPALIWLAQQVDTRYGSREVLNVFKRVNRLLGNTLFNQGDVTNMRVGLNATNSQLEVNLHD